MELVRRRAPEPLDDGRASGQEVVVTALDRRAQRVERRGLVAALRLGVRVRSSHCDALVVGVGADATGEASAREHLEDRGVEEDRHLDDEPFVPPLERGKPDLLHVVGGDLLGLLQALIDREALVDEEVDEVLPDEVVDELGAVAPPSRTRLRGAGRGVLGGVVAPLVVGRVAVARVTGRLVAALLPALDRVEELYAEGGLPLQLAERPVRAVRLNHPDAQALLDER
ncbi:MAG: hypothetical protein U0326_43955 [Polyangiales bacterium]